MKTVKTETRKRMEAREQRFELAAEDLDDMHETLLSLSDKLRNLRKDARLSHTRVLNAAYKEALKAMVQAENAIYLLHSLVEDKAREIEEKLIDVDNRASRR